MSTEVTHPRVRPWFKGLVRRYARRTMGRRLAGVVVDGLEATRAAAARGPIVVVPNHLSWWDTFAMVVVDEALGTHGRAYMDEANLRRLPFFGAIGALPLDLENPRVALRQLKAGRALLRAPGDAVWVFPQGRERPSWTRPLGFQRGWTRLLPDAHIDPSTGVETTVQVVPAAMVLGFVGRPEPLLALHLLPPRPVARGADVDVDALEAEVTDAVDALHTHFADGAFTGPLDDVVGAARSTSRSTSRFSTLVTGTLGQRDDGAGAKLLGRLLAGTVA